MSFALWAPPWQHKIDGCFPHHGLEAHLVHQRGFQCLNFTEYRQYFFTHIMLNWPNSRRPWCRRKNRALLFFCRGLLNGHSKSVLIKGFHYHNQPQIGYFKRGIISTVSSSQWLAQRQYLEYIHHRLTIANDVAVTALSPLVLNVLHGIHFPQCCVQCAR